MTALPYPSKALAERMTECHDLLTFFKKNMEDLWTLLEHAKHSDASFSKKSSSPAKDRVHSTYASLYRNYVSLVSAPSSRDIISISHP